KSGDITEEAVDAIVNAANSTLLGGGGVDGAIHRKGGSAILEECRGIRETTHPNGLPTGEAIITTGGDLPARHVIHTVGPIYGMSSGRDAELLTAAYLNSLALAEEHALASIAFPSISTGAYGFPKHEAAKVVSEAMTSYFSDNGSITEVRLVFFAPADAIAFVKHAIF
ncbi:MAG TPA: O-acetyl-ADP-ribose deacetylase, partial [Pyrinomonadaceae bacterium]|nr:O-acetyl-ADP-ribose deacetylase [Pyrinomonadaceae bacterium]